MKKATALRNSGSGGMARVRLLAALTSLAAVEPVTAVDAPRATVAITQVFVGSSRYIEGSLSYLRIARADRVIVVQGRLRGYPPYPTKILRLRPGRYRVSSWQRPCDGNCGFLDPPTDRRSAPFRVVSARRLHATIRVSPGRGCTIEFGR
jgi:hypothetical protein